MTPDRASARRRLLDQRRWSVLLLVNRKDYAKRRAVRDRRETVLPEREPADE